MSTTAIVSLSNPNDPLARFVHGNRMFRCRNTPAFRYSSSSPVKPSSLGSRFSLRLCPNRTFNATACKRRFNTLMDWQECKVRKVVDVPVSVAYNLYSNRESIPRWMTFISDVQVLKDKPDLSRWTLKYKAFGQNIEYSWLAKNLQMMLALCSADICYLQPIPNQKIHWISLEGLPNRGTVRFFPRGPSSCEVELTFAYEVPVLLIPFAAALQPLMQGMIRQSLEQFAEIVKSSVTKTP